MNKKLLNEFRQKLEKQRDVIKEELESFAKEDPNLKGDYDTIFPQFESHPTSQEENADEVEAYDAALPVEHSFETRLKNINGALEKIKKDEYGICEKCKKNISQERLKASPEANKCMKCR